VLKYKQHLYRAVVEVSVDALDPDSQQLVQMWLDKSGKEPGSPEYEQYQRKLITKILMLSEQPVDQRVNAMMLYRGQLYRAADYRDQLDQVYRAMEDLLVLHDAGDVSFQQYRKELAQLQAREDKLVFRGVE